MIATSSKYKMLSSYFGCDGSPITPMISSDGSYSFYRDNVEHKIEFSLGAVKELHSWKLLNGCYPCHMISYSTDSFDISLVTFADSVDNIGAAAYTRLNIKNTTSRELAIPALPDEAIALTENVVSLSSGQSATLDLAVRLDGDISDFGRFDCHLAAMTKKWSTALEELIDISSPADSAAAMYRATYIFAKLTRRTAKNTDELTKYVQMFLAAGDISTARECLNEYLSSHGTPTHDDIFMPHLISAYQLRCADIELTQKFLPFMKACIAMIDEALFDDHGAPKKISDNDNAVFALKALLSLEAYASATGKLGSTEAISSRKRASKLTRELITYFKDAIDAGSALPLDLGFDSFLPNCGNYTFSPAEAFDMLLSAAESDTPSPDCFTAPSQLSQIAKNLMQSSERLRELPAIAFDKISEDADISPFIANGSISDWCAASKLFIDSFIAMRDSEMLLLGRGLPTAWLSCDGGIAIRNYVTPIGGRLNISLKRFSDSVFIDVDGAPLTAPIITSLPITLSHKYSSDGCECYPEQNRVISMNNVRHIEIKLS